ncbi:hypothetical protein PYW07_015211 [Mythimna separata]|uniref:Odorant receptor n=1 Tax=Mythimna separata TaxID=271217 RepID=A0AAD7YZL1_MYTSE|nr:hypothetical protein PYW07_015211 [Mythimna separata]
MSDERVNPFDSFSEVYKVLIWAGYYKLLKKPKNRFKAICHQVYRPFAFVLVVAYNLAHITFIIQSRGNWDDVFDGSMIGLPHMNLLMKILSLNMNISKVDQINEMINAPIFAAYSDKDEELLLKTTRNMHGFMKFIKIYITISGVILWPLSLFARRFQDPTAIVATYTPFPTDTWIGYSFSVLLESLASILWTGYGHLALDCLVATYYAQAEVQLKIIKYNLEHLFDTDGASRGASVYRDLTDTDLRNRFVHLVQRYEAVTWYTKAVSEVFNGSMSFEFFSCSAIVCVITYRMSFTPVLSVSFIFMFIVLIIILAQVLMYCYFGNMVQYESDSVLTSVYLSDWLTASPKFRRLLLIAMMRWSYRITPTVSGIVPLSLTTFVSVEVINGDSRKWRQHLGVVVIVDAPDMYCITKKRPLVPGSPLTFDFE